MGLLFNFPTPEDGLDAYQTWLAYGNTGTFEDYLDAIKGNNGDPGLSAYQLAVQNGFTGTITQWLESLKVQGPAGENNYQIAVRNGYVGTEAQWVASQSGLRQTFVFSNQQNCSLVANSARFSKIGDTLTISFKLAISAVAGGTISFTLPSGMGAIGGLDYKLSLWDGQSGLMLDYILDNGGNGNYFAIRNADANIWGKTFAVNFSVVL